MNASRLLRIESPVGGPPRGASGCGRPAVGRRAAGADVRRFVRGRRLLGFLAAAGVTLLVGCSRDEPPAAATSPIEASPDQLERREGLLYATGSTQAFTGLLVEPYPSGALKARSEVVRGRLHGISEGWYTHGQLQVREHFSNGVSHGLRQKWHADGTRWSEATIDQGKMEGWYRRWHPNGRLAEEVEMRNNSPQGVARAFDAEGRLLREVQVEAGRPVASASPPESVVPPQHP